ncbi:PepSY-associated TM helix domain-containing protein [uncultured Hyphomonas sp.]|uniref:PepSY-associated TM helix domain-containing protein n=1 Tax=uncultured Hyphomonas sp. TaxID=225298 RepID=UPI002AAACE62|nr:PepSY-associated TM helix domain-containing protein [uncultured Hyphomonas sp.]
MKADLNMPLRSRLLKRPKFNKGAFYRTCRMLHAYLSAAAFILLIFFALTGFLLNHPQWFGAARVSGGESMVELDPQYLDQALNSPDAGKALAELVGATTPIKGAYQDGEVFEDEAYLRFAGVKGTTDIVVDIEAASAEVEVSRANLTSILHDLHRGKDAGPVWKRLIDVTAILIIAMSLAGLILFLSLRFRLATSLKIMGATLGVFAVIFIFLTP